MSLPYAPPEKVATKLRCQFSLKGTARRYDCHSIGCYVLDGKRYCAPHYDIAWKALHPILGQAHDWHFHQNRYTGEVDRYESCSRCGSIKQREGLPQEPCGGVMPRITLRACEVA